MPRTPPPLYSEDSKSVYLRPELTSLIHKMRNLSMLKNRPDSVEHLIRALSYHYFIHESLRPAYLWFTISDIVNQLGGIAGGWTLIGKGAFLPTREDAIKKAEASVPQLEGAEYGTKEQLYRKATWPYATAQAPDSSLGEAPSLWENADFKAAVSVVIEHHASQTVHVEGAIKCRCGKGFENATAWAHHVRIRIWKVEKAWRVSPTESEKVTDG